MNTNWNDPNFQGFGGRQSPFGKRPPRPKKEHKAIGTPLSRTLINLAVTLIFAAVYFYVVLPPINLQAEEFYFFMLLNLLCVEPAFAEPPLCRGLLCGVPQSVPAPRALPDVAKNNCRE